MSEVGIFLFSGPFIYLFLRAIYERQVAKTSLSRRIVDEKNIDRLSVDSNKALMIFTDQTHLPPPSPIQNSGYPVVDHISNHYGNYLSTTPLKMESLMVESKQHLTPSEKRQGIVETTNGLFEDHLRLNSPYSRLFLDF